MNSSDPKNSDKNQKQDQKLETFLKENRPLHPRHSERDAEKIWARISSERAKHETLLGGLAKAFKTPKVVASALSLAVATVALTLFLSSQEGPVPAPSQSVSDAEAAMLEESLELTFLETEEMYEVTDLLSLAK